MTTTTLLTVLLIGATTIAVTMTVAVRRLTRENDTQHRMLVASAKAVAELRTQLRALRTLQAPTAEQPTAAPPPNPHPAARRDPGGTS